MPSSPRARSPSRSMPLHISLHPLLMTRSSSASGLNSVGKLGRFAIGLGRGGGLQMEYLPMVDTRTVTFVAMLRRRAAVTVRIC